MSKTTENTNKLLKFISTKFEKNELNNDSLVEIIELLGMYLNICTIPEYAKREEISYPGAIKRIKSKGLEIRIIFGVKFVIDNS